jgi:16S rRNA (cytidine1402-2'-O)-methyltransferase
LALLYLAATPIGNLEDLTPRVSRILAEVPVVAAESLKRTRALLSHLGVTGKTLVSCRESNRQKAADQVISHLNAGRDVALVSDAGTPGVSDPGAWVVRQVVAAGYTVSPLPGPSALAAALSVSGLTDLPLVWLGFLPAKPGPRRRLLSRAAATGWPLVMFEAPHRLAATSAELAELFGQRPVVLARELSKRHEQVLHTDCAGLAALAGGQETRGEITLIVGGGDPSGEEKPDPQALLREGLQSGKHSPSALARQVAAATGITRDEAYRRLLEMKKKAFPEHS